MLGNTYHLMLRPGAETVAHFGGLAKFAGWDGLTLTDSGGFQVFSLEPKVDDDGVTFQSTYDGSTHRFTPESAVATQELLGADIQMVLDVCPPLPSPPEVVRLAVERTAAWAERARALPTRRTDQALFGIVQGGISETMRNESAARVVDLEFDGYGIGGLSVGETREQMLPALEAALAELPTDRPRYLMGVGDPAAMVEAVSPRGRPVRLRDADAARPPRHGAHRRRGGSTSSATSSPSATSRSIRTCACSVCARHSRGYLRHLFKVGEPTASRLVSIHNVAWTIDLMDAHAGGDRGRHDSAALRADCWPSGDDAIRE